MEFNTKFNFGDKVFQIWFLPEREWKDCGFCGGSGKIYGKDKSESTCPECYGRRGKDIEICKEWKVQNELTIGEIRIESKCEYKPDEESDFTNYGPQEEYYKEVYMCYETGIGSGTLHASDKLFYTEEEALEVCAKLNMGK